MSFNPLVLMDARIYLESSDLTGWSNKVETSPQAADEDITTFASGGWKQRTGGEFDTDVSLEGFFEQLDVSRPDDMFWANLGSNQAALTVAPTSGAAGVVTYLSRVQVMDYKPGGAVGKVLPWTSSLKGNWPLVRGLILHPQGTARTTTGTGTGFQIGAVTTAQRMYACLHVLSVTGTTPSITVSLQSSVDNTFASPTTRITFVADTAIDGQALSLLGAVTDTWWRAAWTISGTTPSFLFACSAGVGPK
jgi:hypothetical protein